MSARRHRRHRRAAVPLASLCVALLAPSSASRWYGPSPFAPPAALAFSRPHPQRRALPPSPLVAAPSRPPSSGRRAAAGGRFPSAALRVRSACACRAARGSEDGGSGGAGEATALRVAALAGVQSLLLPASYLLASALDVPNSGLGAGFAWTSAAVAQGLRWTAPLFAVAFVTKLAEPYSKGLRGVARATQRSVLAVMGRRRRPVFAIVASVVLGGVAGWGEEWLFRGVFQSILSDKFGSDGAALAISGLVFGLLHAVTPLYALMAGLASVFFGYLYVVGGNLAVPIVCHAAYDVGALAWAHWSATGLSEREQDEILGEMEGVGGKQ